MEELPAKNNQLYQELMVQSFELEAIHAKHATKISLTEEEMWEKAMVVVKETRQRDIKELKDLSLIHI